MKIQYYSTNIGVFFKIDSSWSYQNLQALNIVEINGKDVTSLVPNNGWYHFEGELKDFKKRNPPKKKQIGWRLINPEIASEKIPLTLTLQQLQKAWDSEDEDYAFTGSYASLVSLYQHDYTELPSEIAPVKVELVKLRDLHIENYEAPSEMKIQVQYGDYGGKLQVQDLSKVAVFADIERMLTPEFLLHTRPCSLTSEQVYKIVRAHILNNIDGKVARVTSNYDFCFAVEKIIETKPYEVKTEKFTSSLRSYKPPRFTTATKTTKQQKIFEMTWKGYKGNSGYADYTCIEPWEANSLKELYEYMQQYLKDLMQEINKPVVECQHCNGLGCITKTIGTNARQGVNMTDADNLYQQHQAAVKYIYKIGAPQYHLRDGSVGRLIKCEVNTEICHQDSHSAQNYWSDIEFDCALSEVIKEHFAELSRAALNLLKKKALVAEKKELQERLARIEALEKEMGA